MRNRRTGPALSGAVAIFFCFCLTSGLGAEPVITYDPAAGEFPVGVAVDKVGNVWVSLQPICQVRRYTPDWQESLRITLVSDCTNGAGTGGLAVDATGVVYATVVGPNEAVRGVYAIEPSGTFHRLPGTEQMVFPNAIAFDHNNGTMYVTDSTLGVVYRIAPGSPAELWAKDPVLTGIPAWAGGPPLGANGIAVDRGYVIVSVTFLPRLVRIPINKDGSAGAPEVLYTTPALMAQGLFVLDDIALDVFGDVYASVIAGPPTVARLAADGSGITRFDPLPAAVTSLTFGTGKGERKSLFVAINQAFGGTGCGIVKVDAGVPGRPLP